jgi:hypothetical protein
MLENTASRLLEHGQVSIFAKREIVHELKGLRMRLKVRFITELTVFGFGKTFAIGEQVSIRFGILGRMFPTEFESMKVRFATGESHHTIVKHDPISIGKRFLEIVGVFDESGNWSLERMKLYIGKLSFTCMMFSVTLFWLRTSMFQRWLLFFLKSLQCQLAQQWCSRFSTELIFIASLISVRFHSHSNDMRLFRINRVKRN